MNAAAAICLDCMSLRKCHGTDKDPSQRCEDAPYLVGHEPDLPILPADVVLPTTIATEGYTMESNPLSTEPKRALVEWYNSFWKRLNAFGTLPISLECRLPLSNECYTTWSNMPQSPQQRFMSVFTCPLTGERFVSGKFFGEENEWEEDHMYYDAEVQMLKSHHRYSIEEEVELEMPKVDLV